MTERATPEPEVPPTGAPPQASEMPRWIPVLIGIVLVSMAVLAIFTGIRYRQTNNTIAEHVRPRAEPRAANAPPGEPGAGASLVLHDNTPVANEPVQGQARAEIRGGPGGVESTLRYWARRGMVLNVLPHDATVFVNDLPIGEVSQFNTVDEIYDFAEPGSYTVKIVAPSGATKSFIVTASDDAKQDVARISMQL